MTKAGTCEGDILEGLPKEVGRRFGRLRTQLVTSYADSSPLVLNSQSLPRSTPSTPVIEQQELGEQFQVGSAEDFGKFIELCERLERTGGWAELTNALRQEVTNFSMKHARDLEQHAKALGKGGVFRDRALSTDSAPNSPVSPQPAQNDWTADSPILDFTPVQASPSPKGGYPFTSTASPLANNAKGLGCLPLLPPPPPPASGVSTGQLI